MAGNKPATRAAQPNANQQANVNVPSAHGDLQFQAQKLNANVLEDDFEDDEPEKFGTPQNNSNMLTNTNYDVDWASANHSKAPYQEPSEYDAEWPNAHKDKPDDSEWELQRVINSKREDEPKTIRGRLLDSNHPIYNALKTKIKGPPKSNDLRTFKIACLKAKCPLFENDSLRIGVSSTVVHDHNNHKNMLKLVLYFENKLDHPISDFVTDFTDVKNLNRVAKPARLEGPIEVGKQVKQQVIVAFDRVPFECLQLNATTSVEGKSTETFTLFLPSLLPKFMEFKYVNPEVFRERWKMKSKDIIRTEEINVDPSIVKTAYDFKKYFGYLVDLKPMDEYDFVQGKKSIKLGGLFELDIPNSEYLLKINVLPTHQVVFQITTYEAQSQIAAFLLQALAFLFKKP